MAQNIVERAAETVAPTKTLANEGVITRSQLALELGLSEQTIALWEKDGLPVFRIGRQRLFDVKKVAAWIRKMGK